MNLDICTHYNFSKYIKRKMVNIPKNEKDHPRFERAPKIQAQVDWKENVAITNLFR